MRLPVAVAALGAALAAAAGPPRADLTLQDSGGRRVHLRDLRGKPVVLNFWATWCGPCNAEFPLLVSLEREYGPRGVQFLAASLDDAKTSSRVPEFTARFQPGFPVWLGATADDLDRLGLGNAVPATAFLDPEGHIVARILGQAQRDEMLARLEWLTGGRSGPAPQAVVKHVQ